MTVNTASAPVPGPDTMAMPNRMETTPPRAIHHSPVISCRRRTARMMRMTPVAMAQKPMYRSSINAVIPGA